MVVRTCRTGVPRKSRLAMLVENVATYDASRQRRDHDLHCDRALRAIDGLRKFKELPIPPQSHKADPTCAGLPARRQKGGAYHRVGGGGHI